MDALRRGLGAHRGWIIGRVFSHDVHHSAELNEALGTAGLRQFDLWS
jgi:hypothetical protein